MVLVVIVVTEDKEMVVVVKEVEAACSVSSRAVSTFCATACLLVMQD